MFGILEQTVVLVDLGLKNCLNHGFLLNQGLNTCGLKTVESSNWAPGKGAVEESVEARRTPRTFFRKPW